MDRLIYHIAGKDSTGVKKDIFKAGFNASNEPLVAVGTNEINLANTMVSPEGGTAGQVLTKTSTGYDWETSNEVEANPTLSGGETKLDSIKIDGVKYEIGGGDVDDVKLNGTSIVTNKIANIPVANTALGVVKGVAKTDETSQVAIDADGKMWYKDEKGSTVVANPTLAGTEGDLTGLQVGDIKYKVAASDPALESAKSTEGLGYVEEQSYPIWDGDTTGKIKVNNTNFCAYKISDEHQIPWMTPEYNLNAKLVAGYVVTSTGVASATGGYYAPNNDYDPDLIVVTTPGSTIKESYFVETGVYVRYKKYIDSERSIITDYIEKVEIGNSAFTWDGNILEPSRAVKCGNNTYYKISDQMPSADSSTQISVYSSISTLINIDSGSLTDEYYCTDVNGAFLVIAFQDNVEPLDDFICPTAGTYYGYFVNDWAGQHIIRYTRSFTPVRTHKIAQHYLGVDANATYGDLEFLYTLGIGANSYRVLPAGPYTDGTYTIKCTREDDVNSIAWEPKSTSVTDVKMDNVSVLDGTVAKLTTDSALTSAKTTSGLGYIETIPAKSVTWNGDIEGKEVLQPTEEGSNTLYKVDGSIITKDQAALDGAYLVYNEIASNTVKSSKIVSGTNYAAVTYEDFFVAVSIFAPNTIVNGVEYPYAGLYLIDASIGNKKTYTSLFIDANSERYGYDGAKDRKTYVEVEEGIYEVYISGNVLTSDDLLGSYTLTQNSSLSIEPKIDSCTNGWYAYHPNNPGNLLIACALTDNASILGAQNLNKGIYFVKSNIKGGNAQLTKVNIPSFSATHKIDSTYMSSGTTISGKVLTADGNGSIVWNDASDPMVISAKNINGIAYLTKGPGTPITATLDTYGISTSGWYKTNAVIPSTDIIDISGIYTNFTPIVAGGTPTSSEITNKNISVAKLVDNLYEIKYSFDCWSGDWEAKVRVVLADSIVYDSITYERGVYSYVWWEDVDEYIQLTIKQMELPMLTDTVAKIASTNISSGTATSGQIFIADGNGAASWANAPKSSFIINATSKDGENWTVDKTYSDLTAAVATYGANMFINLSMADDEYVALLPLVSKQGTAFTFAAISVDTSTATPTFVYTAKATISDSAGWAISQNLV